MKKKVVTLVLTGGIIAFSSLALNSSFSANQSLQPAVVSISEEQISAGADSATPSAWLASAARYAYVYATHGVKEALKNAAEVANRGNLYGTELQNYDLEEAEQIFDK